jgi:hypothetical protein
MLYRQSSAAMAAAAEEAGYLRDTVSAKETEDII